MSAAYSESETFRGDSRIIRLAETFSLHYLDGGRYSSMQGIHTPLRQFPWATLALVENGRIEASLSGDNVFQVRTNNLLVIPPGLPHKLTCSDALEFRCCWAHVTCTVMTDLDLFDLISIPFEVTGKSTGQFMAANLAVLTLPPSPDTDAILSAFSQWHRLKHVLIDLISRHGALNEKGKYLLESGSLAQRILEIVETTDNSAMSTDLLAERIGLSPSRFRVVFKKIFGCSPLTYITRQRIKRASAMLLDSEQSIAEIACAAGYSDPYYFSRVFSKTTGKSPSAFRRSMRDALMERM